MWTYVSSMCAYMYVYMDTCMHVLTSTSAHAHSLMHLYVQILWLYNSWKSRDSLPRLYIGTDGSFFERKTRGI